MLIYIAVALFPLLVGTYYNARIGRYLTEEETISKKYLRKRWAWLLVAALPMFALIAFRGPYMGADTGVYLKFFRTMVDTPWERIFIVNEAGPNFEPGYVVFEKLVTLITSSDKVYQVIYSTVYLVSFVTFANNLEKHNFSFLFFIATMGVYTFMFTGVRQCLAMCICLWSYPFIKRRKIIPFILILLLAFTFHQSAMFFVVTYFIYNRKISWFNSLFYVIFAILAYVYLEVIIGWLNDQFDYMYGVDTPGNGYVFFAVITLVTAFSFFMILYYRKQTPESVGLLNVGIITQLMWILRLVTRVAERPGYYFVILSGAMLCYALDAPPKSRDRVIYKIAVYSAFVILFAYRLSTGHAALVPYTSFF